MIVSPHLALLLLPFTCITCSNFSNINEIWESEFSLRDFPGIVSLSGTDQDNIDYSRPIGTRKVTAVAAPAIETSLKTLDIIKDMSSLINYRNTCAAAGSDERPSVKRQRVAKKYRFSFLDLSLTHEQVIEAELVNGRKLLKTREKTLGRIFHFFSLKNGCYRTEIQAFKSVFSQNPFDYSRNGVQQYALIMAFVLGFDSYSENQRLTRMPDIEDIAVDMFKYLFSHVPLERAFDTVYAISEIKLKSEESTEIREFINQKYPEMSQFHKILLDLMFAGHSASSIRFIPTSTEELKLIFHMSYYNFIHIKKSPLDIIRNIPFNYTDFYLGTSLNFKLTHLRIVMLSDRLDILIEVLKMEPNLVMYVRTDVFHPPKSNIFVLAVECRAQKCLEYLLELVPDILTSEIDLELSVIHKAIVNSRYHSNDVLLKLLIQKGVTVDFVLTENDKKMNLLQYSFFRGTAAATLFFLNLAGPEKARASIYALWPTDSDILLHAINNFACSKDIKDLCRGLGIDLTRNNFQNGTVVGDVSIFFSSRTHYGLKYQDLIPACP